MKSANLLAVPRVSPGLGGTDPSGLKTVQGKS